MIYVSLENRHILILIKYIHSETDLIFTEFLLIRYDMYEFFFIEHIIYTLFCGGHNYILFVWSHPLYEGRCDVTIIHLWTGNCWNSIDIVNKITFLQANASEFLEDLKKCFLCIAYMLMYVDS